MAATEVEAAVQRLTRLGFKDVEELPISAAKALSTLSDEELKALVHAQKSVKGKVHTMDGIIIF
jgi:hypothetical protein